MENESIYIRSNNKEKENSLAKRRGKIVLSRSYLLSSSVEELSVFFSNFFPIYISPQYENFLSDRQIYYGLSPYFEELKDGEPAPEYMVEFIRDDNGNTKFNRMIKL